MSIDLESLPPRYQAQVRRKLVGQGMTLEEQRIVEAARKAHAEITEGNSREQAVRKKYKNQAATVDGIRFDSQKEARRFLVLRERERRGDISDLRLQVNFTLQEGYTTTAGNRVRPIVYRADFTYRDHTNPVVPLVVEDVKSKATKTRVYELKRKLLREKYGLEITEV